MEKFFTAVSNMFKVPELRKRILFTLGLLAVYRLGAHIQAPGINSAQLERVWSEVAGTLNSLFQGTTPAAGARAFLPGGAQLPTGSPLDLLRRVTVVANDQTNQLLVTGPAQAFPVVEQLLYGGRK